MSEKTADRVEKVPGVWGGRYYMVPRSRIPVFIFATHYHAGRGSEAYPHLDDSQLAATERFIQEHPGKVRADERRYDRQRRRHLRPHDSRSYPRPTILATT